MTKRDYSLRGPDSARAVETGLATAQWYHTEVPRKEMKALMQRSDQPAIRDTILLFGAMILLAGLGIALWPSPWSAPAWLAYGVLYGSAMDSRWHECGHGTAFKTRWMNQLVYQVACFCMMRDPWCWKYSHARHHSDTIIVGRDPEIAIMRPDGSELVRSRALIDKKQVLYFRAAGKRLPEAGWPDGIYAVEVTLERGGEVLDRIETEVWVGR